MNVSKVLVKGFRAEKEEENYRVTASLSQDQIQTTARWYLNITQH